MLLLVYPTEPENWLLDAPGVHHVYNRRQGSNILKFPWREAPRTSIFIFSLTQFAVLYWYNFSFLLTQFWVLYFQFYIETILCFVLTQFCVGKAFQLIDIFFPLSKLLTQLSSMLTRSQCWQKLPHPVPILPSSTSLSSTPTYSSTPCTDDSEGDQFITVIVISSPYYGTQLYNTISSRHPHCRKGGTGRLGGNGVSVSGRMSHRISSPFPQTHKAICRC